VARTGRRPGHSGTREKILGAARANFARQGYDRTTVRMVARSARVDPKLVLHFFGSKHDLFVAAMSLPLDPSRFIDQVTAPGLAGMGERVVGTFIAVWDSPEGRHLVGLLRSVVGHEGAAAMMREFFTHAVLGRLAATLEMDDPRRRATLVASQLFGLAFARYVLRLEPLASASPDDLARWVGPTVQRYLTAG
jgi:AcrR family transcriptional regulator